MLQIQILCSYFIAIVTWWSLARSSPSCVCFWTLVSTRPDVHSGELLRSSGPEIAPWKRPKKRGFNRVIYLLARPDPNNYSNDTCATCRNVLQGSSAKNTYLILPSCPTTGTYQSSTAQAWDTRLHTTSLIWVFLSILGKYCSQFPRLNKFPNLNCGVAILYNGFRHRRWFGPGKTGVTG